MKSRSTRSLSGAVAAAAVVTAHGALARPGCVFQDAHVFTTQTYGRSLIGTIPAPAPVEVVRLGKKWSIISYDGESGYVATAHLSPRSGTRADPPPGVGYYSANNVLRREIDPLTADFWPNGVRYGWRGGPFPGSRLTGSTYFSGFRRAPWTDRTNWRRDSYLAADDPAWLACGPASRLR
jgi:hypothetical protein